MNSFFELLFLMRPRVLCSIEETFSTFPIPFSVGCFRNFVSRDFSKLTTFVALEMKKALVRQKSFVTLSETILHRTEKNDSAEKVFSFILSFRLFLHHFSFSFYISCITFLFFLHSLSIFLSLSFMVRSRIVDFVHCQF